MKKITFLASFVLALASVYTLSATPIANAELGTYAHGEKKILFVPFGYEYKRDDGSIRTEWFYENQCEFVDTDGNPNNDWRPMLERFADSVGEVTNGRITIPHENIDIVTDQALMKYVEGDHENKFLNTSDTEMFRHLNYWQPIAEAHAQSFSSSTNPDDYDHVVLVGPDFFGAQRVNEGVGRFGMPDNPAKYSVYGGWYLDDGCKDMGLLQKIFFSNYGLRYALDSSPDITSGYGYDPTDIMGTNDIMHVMRDTSIVNKLYLDAVDAEDQVYITSMEDAAVAGGIGYGVISLLSKDVYVPEEFSLDFAQGIFLDDGSPGGNGYAIDYRTADGPASEFMDPNHPNSYTRSYYDGLGGGLYVMSTNMQTVQREVSPGVFTEIHNPQTTDLREVLSVGESYRIIFDNQDAFITFIGGSSGGYADVKISDCRGLPPSIETDSSVATQRPPSGYSPVPLSLDGYVTNNNPKTKGKDGDQYSCGDSTFNVKAENLPDGITANPSFPFWNEILDSGERLNAYIFLDVHAHAALGTYVIDVVVTDLESGLRSVVPVEIVVSELEIDTTPPSDPFDPIAVPGTKKNKGDIEVDWGESHDPESGIASYQIDVFFNNNLIEFYPVPGDTTEYIHPDVVPGDYYFTVKAFNGDGLNSNNAVSTNVVTIE